MLIIVIVIDTGNCGIVELSAKSSQFACYIYLYPAHFNVDGGAASEMHLACRYASSHNAVKLGHVYSRSLSTTPSRPARGYRHDPASVPDGRLGSYIPNANPNPRARNIAVVGGGISGLATAFNLTKDLSNAKITVFEKKENLGGWIDSEQVEVDGGTVLFEWGPRTLRPDLMGNGIATLQLVRHPYHIPWSIRANNDTR